MSFSSESHERAPTDLDDLGRAWHKLEAKSRLGEQLLVRIDGLSLQEGFDLERKQGSILTKIQAVNTKLAQANGISRRLEKLRQRQGQDEPSILEDLEHIFQDVYQRGRLPSYCEVKSHLDRLYEQTDHIAQTYLGAGAGIAPLAALQLVAAKLDDSRIEADELQAQAAALRQAAADKSEELANATGQLESVRRRLDAPEASATSILYQLEQREADRDEAFKLLAEFRHNGANSLVDATRNAVDCLDRTRQTLAASLPEEPREGRADVLAERLSERHRELRQNANRAADLCGKFSEYLGFNQLSPSGRQEIDRLHALLDAEMASPHRPLRLGLAASLIAWREALAPIDGRLNGSHVAHALRLDPIDKGLRQLLQRLETTATDDLWTHGLRPGFSRDWLHALFRAQLLLRSFYVDHPELHVLEDAVTLASATVRSAMRRLGKGIEDVELLSPFPDNSRPGWAPPRYLADADLRMLPEVNRRVLGLLDDEKRDNFIVDVERFRLTGDREIAGECRVVVVNPAEWRQSQEV